MGLLFRLFQAGFQLIFEVRSSLRLGPRLLLGLRGGRPSLLELCCRSRSLLGQRSAGLGERSSACSSAMSRWTSAASRAASDSIEVRQRFGLPRQLLSKLRLETARGSLF